MKDQAWIVVAAAALLLAAPAAANVIMSVWQWPYVVQLYSLVFILPLFVLEVFLVGRAVEEERRRWLFADVLVANVLSWFLGVVLISLLPSRYTPEGEMDASMLEAVAAFFLCWWLSALLEGIWYRLRARRLRMRNPWRASVVANCASYSILGAVLLGLYLWGGP